MSSDHPRTNRTPLDRVLELINAPPRHDAAPLLIEGVGNVTQCADHGVRFEQLVLCKRLLRSTVGQIIARRLRARGVPTQTVDPTSFRRISRAERASGIAAVIRPPWSTLTRPGDRCLWLTVDALRSPGNLGTMLRTAAAVGADGLILSSPAIDPFAPDIVRASMGTVFKLRIVRSTARALRAWARGHGVTTIGAHTAGHAIDTTVTFPQRCVLCIGHERHGFTEEQSAMCDRLIRLPMLPTADSLNAGVAAGILLYAMAPHASAQWSQAR
ncbi:MAG: RNA methyltransferase [Planctomycetota bacterium]